jgi:hypothetical protein
MGLLGRVFPFSFADALVAEVVLFASLTTRFNGSGADTPSKLDLLLPSSKKRDCPVAGDDEELCVLENARVAGLPGFKTLIPVSRRW